MLLLIFHHHSYNWQYFGSQVMGQSKLHDSLNVICQEKSE